MMSSFLIRYPFKITPRMSFPISKRLTFFLDLFVYAVFKVHIDVSTCKNQKCRASLLAKAVMHFYMYSHVMP